MNEYSCLPHECDPADHAKWRYAVLAFFDEIGLPYLEVPAASIPGSFLPGIRISQGCILLTDEAFPGDLLHEAGHLATMPAQFRPLATGGLAKAFKAMATFLDENLHLMCCHPEDPTYRGCLQCGDAEATAWQYAAAQHIGLPDAWLFPKGSYMPEGPLEVLASLKARAYMGINGLQAANWTQVFVNPYRPTIPQYPKVAFWLHP